MVRFLRGLDPSIPKMVDIQPYWMFEDVCKLAIKVEKYSKSKRVFGSSHTKPTAPPKTYSTPSPTTPPKGDGNQDKGNAFVKEFLKQLDNKRCFKCQGHDHFLADFPNKRALTLKEI